MVPKYLPTIGGQEIMGCIQDDKGYSSLFNVQFCNYSSLNNG